MARIVIKATSICLFVALSALAIAAASAHARPPGKSAPSASSTAPNQPDVTAYTLPPDKYAKAVAYSKARYRLRFLDSAWEVLVLAGVLVLRLGPVFRNWAERVSSRRLVQAVIFVPLLSITLSVLGIPTDIYGHYLARAYDQSVQGWPSWVWDQTKRELLGLIILTVTSYILYGIIRRSPRRWWFYFWLVSLPMLVFMIFIQPLLIAPLFYKFQPLEAKNPVLVSQIETVVNRAGLKIPPERVFEMEASAKLKSANAYVSGIGASRRVVVWDTTIAAMPPPEILFLFGHEMGHYVLGHIWKGLALGACGLLAALGFAYLGVNRALGRWGPVLQIRALDDWASLPMLLLMIGALGFFASPLDNAFSRHFEHQADIYGLEVIHAVVPDSQQAAARAFETLGAIDLADPKPSTFIRIWFYSHPPLGERIRFALNYDPWAKGRSPKYVK